MAGSLVLVESQHGAAERRIVEFLRPPLFVPLDSEPTAIRVKLFEVDTASLLAATDQLHGRFSIPRYHDPFAVLGGGDEIGKARFRLVYGKFHD